MVSVLPVNMERQICLARWNITEKSFYQIQAIMTGLNQRLRLTLSKKIHYRRGENEARVSWHQVFYRCL